MRLQPGTLAPSFGATALGGANVSLDALRGRTVLLKFYRFATCPICNLHMHRFIQEHPQLEAAEVKTVVFFHSPESKLAATNESMTPFDLVPDPDKRVFRRYGVETGWLGMFSPAVMRDYITAMRAGFEPGFFTSEGGINGYPADFLIDSDGRIRLARYGKHYADSLTVAEVLGALEVEQAPAG